MDDRYEARVLLALLGERWDDVDALVSRRPVDAARFVELARRSDVHPWVHHLLETRDRFDLVGAAGKRDLDRGRHKCRVDNLLLLAWAERALDVLLDADIVPIVLKGLDRLHRFGLDFGARTMDDIDILVPRAELRPALGALAAHGWSVPPRPPPSHWPAYHIVVMSPGRVRVALEVHWNLVQSGRYRLNPDDLFVRAVPLDVAGRVVSALELHDAAAHVLLHHVSHGFDRGLKDAVDLRHLAAQPGFDWSRVAERLADWDGETAGAVALRSMWKLLPGRLTVAPSALLPLGPLRRLLIAPLRSRHPLELVRGPRRRWVRAYLGTVLCERPRNLVRLSLPVRRGGTPGAPDPTAAHRRHGKPEVRPLRG